VLAPFNYNGAIEIVIAEPVVECRSYADDAVLIIRGTNTDAMNISLTGGTRSIASKSVQTNVSTPFSPSGKQTQPWNSSSTERKSERKKIWSTLESPWTESSQERRTLSKWQRRPKRGLG
jgi:hypothetical protein